MYHQIAHNKRTSIVLVALFLIVWLLAGFVIGLFAGSTSTAILGAVILGLSEDIHRTICLAWAADRTPSFALDFS